MSAKIVGFDREIRLRWLDETADLVQQGLTTKDILARLNKILEIELPDHGIRGARGKTITILLRIWVKVPDIVKPLRDDAIKHLRMSNSNRFALHWGLCLTAYPFFAFVAETIGRLSKLQGTFSAIQVQRRIKEHYGERETVSRSVNRIIQSLIDWKVLKETNESRIFEIVEPLAIRSNFLMGWLVEATLISSNKKTALLNAIVHSPSLFPFNMDRATLGAIEESKRLEFFHHNLNEEMVTLQMMNGGV